MKQAPDYYARVLASLIFGTTGRVNDSLMDEIIAQTDAPALIDDFHDRLHDHLKTQLTHGFNVETPSKDMEADDFTPDIAVGAPVTEAGVVEEGKIAGRPPRSTGEPNGRATESPDNTSEHARDDQAQDAQECSAEQANTATYAPGEIPTVASTNEPPQQRLQTRNGNLPNARVGQFYSASVREYADELPERGSLSLVEDGATGLTLSDDFQLAGTPHGTGTAHLQILGTDVDGEARLVINLKLALIQNSRDLWKNLPSDPAAPYAKQDQDVARLEAGEGWHLVMGSLRGRSHAHWGGQRDDHGVVAHTDTGWNLLLVGDGAGSCEFSRQGSLLATTIARDHLDAYLEGADGEALERELLNWWVEGDRSRMPQQVVMPLQNSVITAVHKGYKAIADEAQRSGHPVKAFSTTLLLALHKTTLQGELVVTFGIGDGAIAALHGGSQAKLLNNADSGAHAGQTRFLDSQLFQDGQGLYQRLSAQVFESLDALILASDGVTDPKFVSDNDMREPMSWWALHQELAPVLEDVKTEAQTDPLLDYLDFFIERHHDDRTVAVLYRDASESEVSADQSVAIRREVGEPAADPHPDDLSSNEGMKDE